MSFVRALALTTPSPAASDLAEGPRRVPRAGIRHGGGLGQAAVSEFVRLGKVSSVLVTMFTRFVGVAIPASMTTDVGEMIVVRV